jgi:hypothetical protein
MEYSGWAVLRCTVVGDAATVVVGDCDHQGSSGFGSSANNDALLAVGRACPNFCVNGTDFN